MTLFDDPERWAKSAVGSVWRLILMIVLHIAMCAPLLLLARPLSWIIAPLVFFVGVAYPAMYLYAMFRLIKRVDELEHWSTNLEGILKERNI